MQLIKYTLDQLKEAVKTSQSIRQTLQKLNVEAYGGNYDTFRKAVKYFNIDTSHFTGQSWSKGRTFAPKRPIEDYLSNKCLTQSDRLRKRLIKENILPHLCDNCNLTEWLNNPIPLELHHIDGNRQNNNLSNLKLLCPNCHTLTDNYRGKKKKTNKKRIYKYRSRKKSKSTYIPIVYNYICKACKKDFTAKYKKQIYCSYKCMHKGSHKVKHPTKEELSILIWEKPTTHLAKDFGVSDKAIEKWCKKYQIEKPPRGYWAKQKAKQKK